MYGEKFLYGNRRPVNNQAIYRATTDIDIKVRADDLIPEKILKGDFFSVDEAPNILKSKLILAINVGLAEEIKVIDDNPSVEKELTLIDKLAIKVDQVLEMDSDSIVDNIIKESEEGKGARVIPDVIDGKVSKGSSAIVDAVAFLDKESKLNKFKKKYKRKTKSKLDKFREQRDARK